MKRIFIIAALSLQLGGCAAFDNLKTAFSAAGGFTVTQKQLDAARSTYDGTVLVPMAKYATFPRCPAGTTISITNLCHDKALLKQLRDGDKVASAAFDKTQDMITSGNNSGAAAAWASLQTAINSVKALVAVARGGAF